MTTITIPRPPITELARRARRAATAWRTRDHWPRRARARTYVTEIFCQTCRRWRKPGRFGRNAVICRTCHRHRT
jgi:hypothetical protein